MKKALIIATVGGFLSQFELHNAQTLQELGYEVHYVSNLRNRVYEFDETALTERGIVLHHVNISKNPFRLIRLCKSILSVKEIIQKEQIELVHCHTPVGGVIGRMASKALRKEHKKPYVIYTAHGFHFYKGASLRNWLIYYPVERYLARYTDCLVTINGEDFERSKKMKCQKTVRIPGVGIDVKRFYPNRSKETDKKRFRIVSVGELNQNKNHEIVIRAIDKLEDKTISYDIYGKGILKKELKQLIEQLNLKKRVRLRGFDFHIEERLNEADCFIFPSKREGFGMAALEALACGVPVIAADNRGTREYMRHEENGIVCSAKSVDDYVYAIQRLKESEKLRQQFAENGVKTVQKFTVEISTGIMRKVYEEIL